MIMGKLGSHRYFSSILAYIELLIDQPRVEARRLLASSSLSRQNAVSICALGCIIGRGPI